jgi:hypothetical protein
MRRDCLSVFLICTVILTALPAQASPKTPSGYQYTDRSFNSYQIHSPKTQVVVNHLYSTKEFRQKAAREFEAVKAVASTPERVSSTRVGNTSTYGAVNQSKKYLYQNVNNFELFRRGCMDIMKAASAEETQHNLRDPEKRYNYWKEQGIYDKYTPQQIEFLNRVCARAVIAGNAVVGLGSVVGTVATLGSMLALAAPVIAAVAGGAAVVAGAATLYKWSQVENKGADIALDPQSNYGRLLLGGELTSIGATVTAAKYGGAILGASVTSMVGAMVGTTILTGLALMSSSNIVQLLNATTIPQESEITKINEKSSNPKGESSIKEFHIDYRLTQ